MTTSHRRTSAPPDASVECVSGTVEETHAFGERLGRLLQPGDVVALFGELGSGKTTLIQGIARGLGRAPRAIKSPTFVLLREYPGAVPLIHLDGYRLEGATAVAWLDLDLIFSPFKITVIEWAERFAGVLPDHRMEVRLSHVSANRRRITLVHSSVRAGELLAQLSGSAP
jgi:tRNA threonylcarbamoyladenosine biosynthesis protein TsaE